MFSQGFASGLMSIREESPGRTGRFQAFAEPLAGNVLYNAACPAGQGLGHQEQREGRRGDACRDALLEVITLPCSNGTWVLWVGRWVAAKGASTRLGGGKAQLCAQMGQGIGRNW